MALLDIVERLRLSLGDESGQLDVVSLAERKQRLREMTTTANIGAFAVPLGGKIVRDKKGMGDIKPAYPFKKTPLLRRRVPG